MEEFLVVCSADCDLKPVFEAAAAALCCRVSYVAPEQLDVQNRDACQALADNVPQHPRVLVCVYPRRLTPAHSAVHKLFKAGSDTIRIAVNEDAPADADRYIAEHFDDFVTTPFSPDELVLRIDRFRDWQSHPDGSALEQEFRDLNLVGRSLGFINTLEIIKRVAPFDAPVLLTGETGTGKENVARSIHVMSGRRTGAFVPVNCGALPDNLLESELFGHEKGSFTDASTRQAGLVELAEHGTLLLDEVDSLTPKAQVSLLRFLQTGEYRPLGARHIVNADVRVVAATNADLALCVAQGTFREDLFYRLNVLRVETSPLRERQNDIPLIAIALMAKFAQQYEVEPKKLSARSMAWLQRQRWPGNVRELENVLLREFLLCRGCVIELERQHAISAAGQADATESLSFSAAKTQVIDEFERSYLSEVLTRANGNVSVAARMANKERRALGRLLKKHRLGSYARSDEPRETAIPGGAGGGHSPVVEIPRPPALVE